MLNLYDVVRLKHDREDIGLKTTFIGTVIDILEGGAAYSVEFIDANGKTIDDSVFADFTEYELDVIKSNTGSSRDSRSSVQAVRGARVQ